MWFLKIMSHFLPTNCVTSHIYKTQSFSTSEWFPVYEHKTKKSFIMFIYILHIWTLSQILWLILFPHSDIPDFLNSFMVWFSDIEQPNTEDWEPQTTCQYCHSKNKFYHVSIFQFWILNVSFCFSLFQFWNFITNYIETILQHYILLFQCIFIIW